VARLPTQSAEVVSANSGASLKSHSGQNQAANRGDSQSRAAHLRDAIIQRARENKDSVENIAGILGMSVGHWYRLKKEPQRLGRLTLERIDSISRYVAWPRVQVIVAVGWLQQSEIESVVSAEGAIHHALRRLEHGGLACGLSTPLARASVDHQMLMARLLIAAEGAATGSALAFHGSGG
jgi:hypothetical protein